MDTYSIMVFNYLLPTRVSLDNVYTLDQFINKIKLNDEFRNIIHNIDPYLVPYINDFDIILRKPNHSTSLDYNDPLHRLLIIDMYYNDDYININHLNEIRDIEFFLPLKINIINYSDIVDDIIKKIDLENRGIMAPPSAGVIPLQDITTILNI